MPQAVAAVFPQGAAIEAVKAYVGVYCLDAGALLAVTLYISLYLLRRPLLLHQQREDALAHVEGERADSAHAMLALIAFVLGMLVVIMILAAIALYLAVNCADMYFQVLSYHFFAHFVLE
jgi:hypothetical protein